MNDKKIARPNAGGGAVGAGPVGRFYAHRKLAAVQRLLRGEGGRDGVVGSERGHRWACCGSGARLGSHKNRLI